MVSPSTLDRNTEGSDIQVRQFQEILIWPVQLMSIREGTQIQAHWERLSGPGCLWRPAPDLFASDAGALGERHYAEFVAFMPHVQRFLYGESATAHGQPGYGASPIHVFRRHDVARARVSVRALGPMTRH